MQDAWDLHMDALKAFVAREKHCDVPSGHKEGALRLGLWVGYQQHRWAAGKLEPAKEQQLSEMGLELRPRSSRWDVSGPESKPSECRGLYRGAGHLQVARGPCGRGTGARGAWPGLGPVARRSTKQGAPWRWARL